ncbi:MAG: aminopeptidase N [Actinobacteria bacterium]|nr:aminopeptidase N [Actinomycetota bacterium]NCX33290.1 aminopeptidase N [Actinomycetota bacterium]
MPGNNLSRAEAADRSAHLKIHRYDVTLDVTTGEETFYSKSKVTFACSKPGYSTFIDAVGKRLISATLNGKSIEASEFTGQSLFLKDLQAENELVVEVEAIYSKTGEGLQRSVDPVDNEVYLYSQGETAFIRNMYPCFDQPDLKSTFDFTVIAPAHWEVISNNPVKNKSDVDGKKKWEFTTTPIMSTYITAVVAGPYAHVHDEYNGKKKIPMGIYCRKSLFQHLDADEIFLVTKQGFEYFERVFGLAYAFDKYDQIAVVDFNWGAMENAGCVTFREELLVFRSKVTERMYNARANTILHEMAHMWFGNLVTMKWWDDLWLNESFAEWSSYLALVEATRFKNSWAGFNAERKNWAYRQDQLSSTHPIAADMVDIETVKANFDGITYAKGASVLHQLVAHVGRDNFIAGLQVYFAKHAYRNTTLKDLLDELEAKSGRSLDSWVATWLQTAGVNTLRPEVKLSGDTYESIAIKQEPPLIPAGSTEKRPHRMAVGLYDLKGDVLSRRTSVELDVAGELTSVDKLKGEKVADLLLINDKDLSYAKIRFDQRSIDTLKSHLGKLNDNLSRALCWSAAWDMLRDAEISSSDFIDIAIAGLPGEDDITTVTALGNQLSSAIEVYAAPKNRDSLREKIATVMGDLLERAKPGSDFQLQFARFFASLAHTQAQGAKIRELLDGKLNGLTIDADLRWHLLICLVERGLAGVSEIDAELQRDNTLTGQLARERCLAAQPNLEAKEKAFKTATENFEISNWMRLSAIQGFARPLHRDFHAKFIDRYFGLILDIYNTKSYEDSSNIIDLLFPSYVVSNETLAKTDAWLTSTGKDAHPTLRRHVLEAKDSLVRALKVQAVDR